VDGSTGHDRETGIAGSQPARERSVQVGTVLPLITVPRHFRRVGQGDPYEYGIAAGKLGWGASGGFGCRWKEWHRTTGVQIGPKLPGRVRQETYLEQEPQVGGGRLGSPV
jgi:hypothetical protein